LAGEDVQAIVAAYKRGRGARKEIKAATEAVKRALESYGKVWRNGVVPQAISGARSSCERPTLTPASTRRRGPADRAAGGHPAAESAVFAMPEPKNDPTCATRWASSKKRIPKDLLQSCQDGEEDEDEEDEDKPAEQPKQGEKESQPKEGREAEMTPEQAARLLDLLKLDATASCPWA